MSEQTEVRENKSFIKRHPVFLSTGVPLIMFLVMLVCVFFALRMGAERSMKEYISFHGTSYDFYAVDYSEDDGDPERTVVLGYSDYYYEQGVKIPVTAEKYVYSFKNKKSAEEYAQKLAKEGGASKKITLLNKYVITIPEKYEGSNQKYGEKFNPLAERLEKSAGAEKEYKIFVAFGGKEIE